jgi:hypothetical protein
MFTVQQKSSGRFMDAREFEEKDFALVTRPAQKQRHTTVADQTSVTPVALRIRGRARFSL